VLIVGAGGLGCPAAQYLAAAGIGCIGIVDYDNVEISNLHRQVIHGEGQVGIAKVTSAGLFINSLNSNVKVVTHCLLLNSSNALDIIRQYDVVLDATDNLPSRYLLNDSCVILKKPLVSGSALRFEGQLTVYNHDNGPCYRCLYPSPPPPHTVTNCSEGGVLGVVPGIIGSLQALETLKLITGIGDVLSGKLLLFDGLTASFRVVTLRSHDPNCSMCGDNPTIKELIDYEVFCNSTADDKENQVVLIGENDRISCQEYKAVLDQEAPHVLIDVREPVEYDICRLDNSHNIPLSRLQTQSHTSINSLISDINPNDKGIYMSSIVCHVIKSKEKSV
jgi:adenylyltransferase/sulfurtransferase